MSGPTLGCGSFAQWKVSALDRRTIGGSAVATLHTLHERPLRGTWMTLWTRPQKLADGAYLI